ncbi:hypothetical protein IJ670_08415, partial [bacterium]|nr:hypothetical protein [bacterium]
MKVSSINNSGQYTSINNSQRQGFSGVADGLVKFWQFVDNGGRAMQFTVEDMLGTNIPRSVKGATAGIEYTHEFNLFGFLQEFVREILTGPTMCIVPWVIINLCKKGGKTANTHGENIKNLSYLMSQFTPQEKEGFVSKPLLENAFFTKVSKDMLENSIGTNNVPKEDINALVDVITKYHNNTDKKQEKDILKEAQLVFEGIIKKNKKDYNSTSFLNAKYTVNETRKGSVGFKNYVGYISSYINDFTKQFQTKVTDSNIKNFRHTWLGKRHAIIACMIGITGILMAQIPKLYTLVSGT